MKTILILGLPDSGKTTLALALKNRYKSVTHINGDEVRKIHNDWDFSTDGRLRQALRIKESLDLVDTGIAIVDFVCPLESMRNIINADITIWVDTIDKSKYEDTNKLFELPLKYDYHIIGEKNALVHVENILSLRSLKFNSKLPTVQMLGRWQPWHAGHMALFERAIVKTGQVSIMVRDCSGIDESNPFDFKTVKWNITRALDNKYLGKYEIILVPNITNITYGRSVGYSIEQEVFDESIHSISATRVRKSMGY